MFITRFFHAAATMLIAIACAAWLPRKRPTARRYDFQRLAAFAILLAAIFAGCVLAQEAHPPILNLQPGPALPANPDLVQNAAMFFKTANATAAAITQTMDLVGKGIYMQGVKDGAMGAGILALIAYLIVSKRSDPPKPA